MNVLTLGPPEAEAALRELESRRGESNESALRVPDEKSAGGRAELQYACRRLGIREIYRAGGASAVAAMALGTESLERVDKIAGPGNQYVTAAKARLIGEVGIDMTAGPTELVVVADETSD